MKFSSIFCGLLLVSFSLALPKNSTSKDILGKVQGKVGKAIKSNVAKMCIGTGMSGLKSTCPKPLQYCDMRIPLTPRCRYNGGAWFLFIGLPLMVIGIIIGVVVYIKKR